MKELDIFTNLHKKTNREYLPRMYDDKVNCMVKAKEFEADFWDGDRKFGYGGYKYDGRWEPVAKRLIEIYKLKNLDKVLDVGCGKAFLLYELKKLLPNLQITGFDISKYALKNAKEEVKDYLFYHDAKNDFPFKKDEFDLAISLTTLHNLKIYDLKNALQNINFVAKNKFVVVESYRNEKELFNLECWALTCQSFFSKDEWEWLFKEFGYNGDYEFIYFE
ncbi:class I SAM-dependent methyltransferase [Campylobacter fetus]|uniref:class I SAM-dependent methyltransferase n=1 Tax=Campylobacter fetus TaxID=196 RepID=UPI0003C25872|nr:class I SAM-dependent methyltransferase [Campylobacter fetus]AGZ82392.1 SAM-dependent methyltransferase [Campylobacter fetus subsp. testudinum 03-427]AJB46116.1 SAM-dependent methyltransferase [Campylobacter fetus subsp. testudinum]EAI4322691.1 class I SAM-dependent methyltransferase [Campylobacter fetus]EAI4392083.1 class I SAM-dependent methyltransferase [Campylobacter fetus]OCS06255.1 SAM-dependent methyltransferase [Campylobacter fetus subsp. testudinum]